MSLKNPHFSKIWKTLSQAIHTNARDKITQLLSIHRSSITKPLQKSFEHLLVSILGPTQSLPFPDGGELLQNRALLFNPPPQDFVQTVQSLQLPYFPSTKQTSEILPVTFLLRNLIEYI